MLLPSLLLLLPLIAAEPRDETPRPDLERVGWVSLNGAWDFCFDPDGTGAARELMRPGAGGFDQRIVVPFPWESALSGIQAPTARGVAWYRRSFSTPTRRPSDRLYLCFGAVDQSCRVWVNGREVGGHAGGYTPFRLDISEALASRENQVVVRVLDETDPHLPTGKQVGWYTTTSGIWQPVWLETAPVTHVTGLAVEAALAPTQATLTASVWAGQAGPATLRVTSVDGSFAPVEARHELTRGSNAVRLVVPVPNGRLWTPESPQLYDYQLTLDSAAGQDSVRSYFGLRTVSTAPAPGGEHSLILLNGRPVYLRGALHQLFNPEGIYTFASDQAIRNDIELAKGLGWNFLRLHIKLADPRLLYWADRLGILLMADLPCTAQYSPRARDAWEAQLHEAIARDRSHPSLIAWCLFNETWGLGGEGYQRDRSAQRWVQGMFALAKRLDWTRLVEDNSPCLYDHVVTDLNTWHFYIDDHAAASRHLQQVAAETRAGSGFNFCPGFTQGKQPLLNSEYGAVGAGSGDRDVSWGFKYLTTLLRAEPKCQGYVYTEHCDIEWEHNGLLCYDRTPKVSGYDAFVPQMTWADLQGPDFIGAEGPPVLRVQPGGRVSIRPFLSHYSERPGPVRIRYTVVGWDNLGRPVSGPGRPGPLPPAQEGMVSATWAPATVTWQQPIVIDALPPRLALGALTVELLAGGERLAANYVNLVCTGNVPAPTGEALDDRTVALRFRPGAVADFTAPEAPQLLADLGRDKLCATGRPSFTYHLRLPPILRGTAFDELALVVEAGARGGAAKLDWPARRNPLDYPQTKARRATPSALRATFEGAVLGTVPLADDFADSRGVLSHLTGWHHGSHGARVEMRLSLRENPALVARLSRGETLKLTLEVPSEAPQANGLSLYGETMGRYPLPPTILLTATRLPVAAGWTTTEPVTCDELSARRERVVPAADEGGSAWRYTIHRPLAGWESEGFDDSAWAEGKGGFGAEGTPGAVIGTTWRTADIWLRKRFRLERELDARAVAILRYYHDEDVEIYLNGELLLSRTGYTTAYREDVLPSSISRRLRAGENTFAVHCRQTMGGQNVDLGLSVLRAAP